MSPSTYSVLMLLLSHRKSEDLEFKLEEEEITLGDELKVR